MNNILPQFLAVPGEDESIVPEDIEDGSILDEEEADTQGQSKVSPSAIEEYMKEHPEVKQMPTTGTNGVPPKMKRVYNKFGDVVSIPDTTAEKPKVESKTPKQSGQMIANPYPYYNPYAMNPYINQFGAQNQQQSITGNPQMPGIPLQLPPGIPPPLPPGIPPYLPPGSSVTLQGLTKYQLQPRTAPEEQVIKTNF